MSNGLTFFDHQDIAKRRSGRALAGFFLTVLLTAAVVGCIIGYAAGLYIAFEYKPSRAPDFAGYSIIGGGATLLVILVSWLWRYRFLSAGPASVMKSMRGERIAPDIDDPARRRLMNLVEEMSIASGVPMPDVYLLEARGINACACGLEVDQAAIGVTRGAVEKLSRDELQGVIAHEYSHILHGDMAMNTQMIAWLAGLFTVGELGRFVMCLNLSRNDSLFRSNDRESGGSHPAAMMAGALIWLAGSVGMLFGRMLQASVSRQREYLADASAVQYTRNPDGLGNALRKLGTHGVRGRMIRPNTDCAHMMFSSLRSSAFDVGLSTHPPLDQRIRRILPHWDGTYLQPPESESDAPPPPPPKPGLEPSPLVGRIPETAVLFNLLDQQQAPDAVRLERAAAWRDSLPKELLESVRDSALAPAAALFLLIRDPHWETQLEWIGELLGESTRDAVRSLLEKVKLPTEDRLSVVDLTLPALRQMPKADQPAFLETVDRLSRSDDRIDLFEYALDHILHHALEAPGGRPSHRRMRIHIRQAAREVNTMLGVMSWLGSDDEAAADAAFQKAKERMTGFTAGVKLERLPREACTLRAMDQACEKLPRLAPNFQERLLLAGLAAAYSDGELEAGEREAFRAFAAAMRIPVPPALGF